MQNLKWNLIQSEIVRYRLQTIPFPLEKTNITGFIGNICIHIYEDYYGNVGGIQIFANTGVYSTEEK